MLKKMKQILKDILGLKVADFSSDVMRFRIITSFKVMSISVLTLIILSLFIWLLLKINLIFFESNGFLNIKQLNEAYYEYILSTLQDFIILVIVFLLFMGLVGFYLSELFLRPFQAIGQYAQSFVDEKDTTEYDPGFFSNLKLLARFSEFFFNILENAIANQEMKPFVVPSKFTRIHKPVFEGSFFMQYFLIILSTSVSVGVSCYIAVMHIHDGIIELSIDSLKQSWGIKYFMQAQQDVFVVVVICVLVVHLFLYLILSVHLYNLVAPPAFGIFATMRAFLKGSYNARVHLIGYKHVREDCRKFNKYLDKIQKTIIDQKEGGTQDGP